MMASLRFLIDDIPEEGLEVTRQVRGDEFLLADDDPVIVGEFSVSASLQLTGLDVLAQGESVGTLLLGCVRCLDEFHQPIQLSFVGLFCPEATGQSPVGTGAKRGDEESPDEVERYVIQDGCVDLGGLLREQVILSVPIQPLCAPDCKGLCAQCGENLNVKSCGCLPGDLASPFAAMKNLLKLSGESRTSS